MTTQTETSDWGRLTADREQRQRIETLELQEREPGHYVAPVIGESHYRIDDIGTASIGGPFHVSWCEYADGPASLIATASTLEWAIVELSRVSGTKVVLDRDDGDDSPSVRLVGSTDRIDAALQDLESELEVRRTDPVGWVDVAESAHVALELEQLVAKLRAMRAGRSI